MKDCKWKRFWIPKGETPKTTEDGFLKDPTSPWAKFDHIHAETLESIEDKACCVLLGEPGMGKSTVLDHYVQSNATQIETNGDVIHHANLARNNTDMGLCNHVFDHPKVRNWKEGSNTLYLLLDSLDEVLDSLPYAPDLIIEKLTEFGDACSRLRLRISCRSLLWPRRFEDSLKKLWNQDEFVCLELAPLRCIDVETAVRQEDLDAPAFLEAVSDYDVGTLAARPITLNFLLCQFREGETLSGSSTELFENGCREICRDNPTRRERGLRGKVTPEDRFELASLLAFSSLLSGRDLIWSDRCGPEPPANAITLQNLQHDTDSRPIVAKELLSEAPLEEVLNTGLFTGNRWAHKSYQEFLAARFLQEKEFTIEQLRKLFLIDSEAGVRTVPLLHGTAQWLAAMNEGFLQELLDQDPMSILGADLSLVQEKFRANLVERLLDLLDCQDFFHGVLSDRDYKRLEHSNLATQLRPFLQNPVESDPPGRGHSRSTAIRIAEACSVESLSADLIKLALNPEHSPDHRGIAIRTIGKVGSPGEIGKLKELISEKIENDENHEVLAQVLSVLWPDYLTAEELFVTLVPPPDDHMLGTYDWFLSHELIDTLKSEHLPAALTWLAKVWEDGHPDNVSLTFLNKLTHVIFRMAFRHLTHPEILAAFVIATYKSEPILWHIFGDPISDEDGKIEPIEHKNIRRSAVEKIIQSYPQFRPRHSPLMYLFRFLVLPDDISWYLECISEIDDQESAVAHAQVLGPYLTYESPHIEEIYNATLTIPAIQETFAKRFEAVPLNSELATEQRKIHEIMSAADRRDEKEMAVEEERLNKILKWLAEVEEGEISKWVNLGEDLFEKGNIRSFETSISDQKVWNLVDSDTKHRLLKAAKAYVVSCEIETGFWVKHLDSREELAGYRGIRLLWERDSAATKKFPDEVWQRYAPTIVEMSNESNVVGVEGPRQLLEECYKHAPNEILAGVKTLIDTENSQNGQLHVVARLDWVWDKSIEELLLQILLRNDLTVKSFEDVLAALLQHRSKKAKEYAVSNLPALDHDDADIDEKAVVIAACLLNYTPDASWANLEPLLQANYNFGKRVIEQAVDDRGREHVLITRKLKPAELASLYIWLDEQFPGIGDTIRAGASWATTEDHIADLKRDALTELREDATGEGYEHLCRIERKCPNFTSITWHKEEALQHSIKNKWTPPSPEELLSLAGSNKRRIIQSERDLQEAVLESLKRFEASIHGENPLVNRLWNAGKNRSPKPESTLSDEVREHLANDLIDTRVIVNREVQIHSHQRPGRPDSLDIKVEAILNDDGCPSKIATVIIESKGCWNRDLLSDMECQLAKDYLSDNNCEHGIYLVGYYDCNDWKDCKCRHEDIVELRKKLSDQGESLSINNLRIRAFVLDATLHPRGR